MFSVCVAPVVNRISLCRLSCPCLYPECVLIKQHHWLQHLIVNIIAAGCCLIAQNAFATGVTQRLNTKIEVLVTQDRAHLLSNRSIMRERRRAWRSRVMRGEREEERHQWQLDDPRRCSSIVGWLDKSACVCAEIWWPYKNSRAVSVLSLAGP